LSIEAVFSLTSFRPLDLIHDSTHGTVACPSRAASTSGTAGLPFRFIDLLSDLLTIHNPARCWPCGELRMSCAYEVKDAMSY